MPMLFATNVTGALLADEHRRAAFAERLAAIGRLAAGLAHEIRNPIAAMRLKAENALAGDDNRRVSALKTTTAVIPSRTAPRGTIPIEPAAPPVPYPPRFRALAL
jgi:C4-dicarboxylate-specific signal transduction histidine kinase